MKEKRMTKIVITGGPCAGKTTAMSWIQKEFTQKGYAVLFISETATELIGGGVAPWTCMNNIEYQKCQMKLQLEKEKIFFQAAKGMKEDHILIVCDRGTIDNKAYMSDDEFKEVIDDIGLSEIELRDHYDAVFHLVTAAKGAEEYYTTANNHARTETIEEASIIDDKLIAAWTGHPHFRIIDNDRGFEEKLKRLISEISLFLGEPVPYEIERKYLIEYPNIAWLESYPSCKKVDIIQTYLKSNQGDERRVRQRGADGSYIYFETIKRKISDIKRVQIERRLSKTEYHDLLLEADPHMKQITKTRYCLTYQNQYFEIDLFPFWNDRAIAEIDLYDENETIIFPEEIKVIKEVTDDEQYKNASLARIK